MGFGAKQEIETLQRELRYQPDNPQLLIKLATLFERLEQWVEANTCWEKASRVSRQCAPDIYEKIKHWKKLKQYLEDLSSQELAVRRSAADTLGCLKDPRCLYKLVPLLTDRECQWNVAQAIRSINSLQAGRYLAELLSHSDHLVRVEVLKLMGYFQLEAYVPEMIQLLQDEHFSVVKEAATVLGIFPEAQSASFLLPLLDSANLSIRHAVIESLGKLHHPQTLEKLVERLQKKTPSQIFILRALGQFGDSATFALFPFLESPERELREQAIQSLLQIAPPTLFEKACQLISHSEAFVRLTAVQILIRMQTPKSILPLQKQMSQEKEALILQTIKSGLVNLMH